VGERGGWHVVLAVLGYLGSFLTGVYTFRMIFRAFLGDPVPEARELEQGHVHHAETPTNPMTGEEEDTDVGFPGPEHHIAERSFEMKVAMGLLALLAIVGGLVQVPGVTHVIDHFLEPAFHDSRYYEDLNPSDTSAWVGLAIGAAIALAGIAVAYLVWVRNPGTADRLRERLTGPHRLFVNKWYFDEIIDTVAVRPAAWVGRFAHQTFERLVIDGLFVGGTLGVVRAGSAAVRAAQSGFLRYYAALLLLGLGAVALYFLLRAS
jgi:NADH-quinone oxidoreductase subunit L